MAASSDKERAVDAREAARPQTGQLAQNAPERGVADRRRDENVGNPGKLMGTQYWNGMPYAKYEATKGTWVSASMVDQGYDRFYGRDTAYGSYLGIVLGKDGKPLQSPDKIVPGQEYFVPIGTAVSFDPEVVPAYRAPQTQVSTSETWKEKSGGRAVKDLFVGLSDLPYGSFELKGPRPPTPVPRDAVAFWLRLHQREITQAERRWHVSRLAIAGVIAWEALENPEAGSFKAVSVGKIHLVDEHGELTWSEALEQTGRVKERPLVQRRAELGNPSVAINELGAIFDLIAWVAEQKNWNLRNSPEVLGQVYHSRTPQQWVDRVATRGANAPFEVVPGTMGKWILDNQQYLRSAVGAPGTW